MIALLVCRSPCSVDAVLYAYLAPLLKAPLPSNSLQVRPKLCRWRDMSCGICACLHKRP
jgi:hypothetical protein